MAKQTYHSLNALKFFAAFFVVCIHAKFPDPVGDSVMAVASFAVPVFFMISGFFFWHKDVSQIRTRCPKRIKSTLVLLAWLNVLYFLKEWAADWVKNGITMNYFASAFSFDSLVKWLVFNETYWCIPLWYLFAMLYVYLLFFILLRFRATAIRKVITLAPLLLVGFVGMEIFCRATATPPLPDWVLRNAYFDALPFFAIGCVIKMHFEKVKAFINKIPNICLALIAIALVGTQVVEGLRFTTVVYISTIFLACFLFVLAATSSKNDTPTLISKWGKDHSGMVYCIHLLVLSVYAGFAQVVGVSGFSFYQWTIPVMVFLLTLAASAVLQYIWRKWVKA